MSQDYGKRFPHQIKTGHLIASSCKVPDESVAGDGSFHLMSSPFSNGVLMNNLATGEVERPCNKNYTANVGAPLDNRFSGEAQSKNVDCYYCYPCTNYAPKIDVIQHEESKEHCKCRNPQASTCNQQTFKDLLSIDSPTITVRQFECHSPQTKYSGTQYLSDKSGSSCKEVDGAEFFPHHEPRNLSFRDTMVDSLSMRGEYNEEMIVDYSCSSKDSIPKYHSIRREETGEKWEDDFISREYPSTQTGIFTGEDGINSCRASLVEPQKKNLVVKTIIRDKEQFEKLLVNALKRYLDLDDKSIKRLDGGKVMCVSCGNVCSVDGIISHLSKKKHFFDPSWINGPCIETIKLNLEFLNFFLAVQDQYAMWLECDLKLGVCIEALVRLKKMKRTGYLPLSRSNCLLPSGSRGYLCNEIPTDDLIIVCTNNNGILKIESPSTPRITGTIMEMTEKYVLLENFVKRREDGKFVCLVCHSCHSESEIFKHLCQSTSHHIHSIQTHEGIEEKIRILKSLIYLQNQCSKMRDLFRIDKKCVLTNGICYCETFRDRITSLRNIAMKAVPLKSLCTLYVETYVEPDISSVGWKSVITDEEMEKDNQEGQSVPTSSRFVSNQEDQNHNAKKTIVRSESSSIVFQEEFDLAYGCTFMGEFEPYECKTCRNKFFSKLRSLKEHYKTHTANTKFECDVCHYVFGTSKGLKKHCKVHTAKEKFECDVCHFVFGTSKGLNKHRKTHTAKKEFECDVCHMFFGKSGSMKQHRMTHTAKKEFECDVCHKSFGQSESLKQHLKTHTAKKEFECDVCHKFFGKSGSMKQHRMTHTAKKEFECDVCHKSFGQSESLKQHLKTHTAKKEFECDMCHKSFGQSESWKQHCKTHC